MQNTPAQLPIEDLLAHSDWVRRLVGGLVFDPSRADDAVQETWAAALERPPREDVDLRAWLAAVARNAVRKLGRGESRRKQREQVAAQLEAPPDTVDVLAKARLQRRMVDAVLELDEPYRTTLLLRFFEELPPREIAQRLDRPVNTVRTHLERGLAKLRSELDAEYGDRETWGFALLPLCVDRTMLATSGSLLLKTGGILMLCKYVLPAAVVVSLFAVWIGSDAEPDTIIDVATRDVDELSADPVAKAPIAVPSTDLAADSREELPIADTTPSTAAAAPLQHYAGRVVDLAGRSLAGVELQLADPDRPRYRDGRFRVDGLDYLFEPEELEALESDPQAVLERLPGLDDPQDFARLIAGEEVGVHSVVTDQEGLFAADFEFEEGLWSAADENTAILSRGRRKLPSGESEQVYVMTELSELTGRVVDEGGRPIESVRVMAYLRPSRLPGFPVILEDEEPLRSAWAAETDSAGRFTITRCAVIPGATVRFTAERYESLMHTISGSDSGELEIVLLRSPERKRVAGRVVDQAGQPAIHAPVTLDWRESMTDEQGQFYFEVDSLDGDSVLVAYQQGYAPAIMDDLSERLEEDPEGCSALLLQLGGATSSIGGRVVDERGSGIHGVAIWVMDSTRLPRSAFPLEGRLSTSKWEAGQTDEAGRFELQGLYREDYDLAFVRLGDGASIRLNDVPIDTTDLNVAMDDSLYIRELQGRVLDRRGRVVVGAELAALVMTYEEAGGGTRYTSRFPKGETAENGEFHLRRVPIGNTKFVVRGTGIEETEFELDPNNAQDLTFVVPLRLRFQLDPDVAPGATSFEIQGEAGTRLKFKATYTDRDIYVTTGRLKHRDALPTIEVGDEANEIVFLKDGVEVDRKPLHLRRGEVTRVR
jgi:RNA polymerase sigma factor (sigma-70 family)